MARNAMAHLEAADNLVSLIAVALQLGHPSGSKMVPVNLARCLSLSDAQIDVLTARLEAWIADQPGAIAPPKGGT